MRPDPAWHTPAPAPAVPVGAVEQAMAAQLRAHAHAAELADLLQRLDP